MSRTLLTSYLATSSLTYRANTFEVGVDEVGRGPMLGRVYTAAVILPKDSPTFQYHLLKDSKRFHSEKRIQEVSDYIKANAISYHISYCSEGVIDDINIRQATLRSMHECIREVIKKQDAAVNLSTAPPSYFLLIDGNDFRPFTRYVQYHLQLEEVPYVCIEGGDDKYCSIAAASILAKVARDAYIAELCASEPDLVTKYDLLKNKGYGTKKHMEGLKEHGLTPYHRKTFGQNKFL